jgi:hypothetical protein
MFEDWDIVALAPRVVHCHDIVSDHVSRLFKNLSYFSHISRSFGLAAYQFPGGAI